MTDHTHLLRRRFRAALATAAVASIAVVGVACAPTGQDPSGTTAPSADADADGANSTGGADGADGAQDTTGTEDAMGTATTKGGTASPGGKKVLDTELSGQEAIDALGDEIDYVAKLAGKTPDEVEELLLRDPSAHVTTQGRIVYRDNP